MPEQEKPADHPVPRVLCDLSALDTGEGIAGAAWRLAEPDRQLDANVVSLPAGHHIGDHAEPDLDVLVLVLGGGGTLTGRDATPVDLVPGRLLWLPHGSSRAITAGPDGLRYLTAHRRRPGLMIKPRSDNG